MSRSRTVERRKEKEQQKRRRQQQNIIIAAVAVAVIVVALLVFANQPAEAPVPAEAAAQYEGIAQSTTDEGFPLLGDPESPVTVREYSSFACIACKVFHDNASLELVQRVRRGEINFVYVPMFSTGSIPNGAGAARAAVCAGAQGKFWQFHGALFQWQGLYANTAYSENRLASGINNLGIDRGQWEQCMASELPGRVTDAAEQASRNVSGFGGTPSITVNGVLVPTADLDSVNRAIDAERTRLGLPARLPDVPGAEATSEATPEATAEATPETAPEATPETTPES